MTHYPETLGASKQSADRPDSAGQDSPGSDVSLPQRRHVSDVTSAQADNSAADGTDVIDPIWQHCLSESLGHNDKRNRTVTNMLIDDALASRRNGRELREEFDRLAS